MAISIDEIPSLSSKDCRFFVVNFHGEIIAVTVTANTSIVRRWITGVNFFNRYFLHRLVVGSGVQWTPGYKDDPADTLQICVGNRCLIYQLNQADYVPKILRRFLLNPNNTFVGFWNNSDRDKLEKTKHKLEMYRDPLDLRYVVMNNGQNLTSASMEEIVEKLLGYTGARLDRKKSMNNWNDKLLSHDQVLQASLDAFCAFQIGKNIRAWKLTSKWTGISLSSMYTKRLTQLQIKWLIWVILFLLGFMIGLISVKVVVHYLS